MHSTLLHVSYQLDEPQDMLQLSEADKLKTCLEVQRRVAGMKMEGCGVKLEFGDFCRIIPIHLPGKWVGARAS